MRVLLLSALVASSLGAAVPTPLYPRNASSPALDASSCPGYAATNIITGDSSLTADLTLDGDACNVYGDDLKNLKLEVEYQTSEYQLLHRRLDSAPDTLFI